MVGETRYTAWGEMRYDSGTVTTDYTYTGQYSNTDDFGWMYFKARWYDAALGRFAQADSIVPETLQGTQAWDRYAYVNNNPIKNSDDSGYCIDGLTTVPCLLLFIGVAGFAGAAANYQFNESGHSWWESTDDAINTFSAGMDGAVAAFFTAQVAVTAALTGQAAYDRLSTSLSSSFSGLNYLPDVAEQFEAISDDYPPGSFDIIDWSGYPTEGNVPKPEGPFRLLYGEEYKDARNLADQTNRSLHLANPEWDDMYIHEIHPVKFGGSPTDLSNKIVLPSGIHSFYTNWWNRLQRAIE